VPGSDGVTHARINCYACNNRGHYAGDCPDAAPEEEPPAVSGNGHAIQMLQHEEVEGDSDGDDSGQSEFTFNQNSGHGLIPSSWVLLDSQSTVSVFYNKRYLKNIRKAGKTLTVFGVRGSQVSSLVGDTSFGTVWYNPKSLGNILSMAMVKKLCHITMDTSVDGAMFVHRNDGSMLKFQEFASGLHYYDVETKSSNHGVINYPNSSFIQTVKENKTKYTKRKIQGADDARRLYRNIGRISERDLKTF